MIEDIDMFAGLSVLLFIASFMAAFELAQYVEGKRLERRRRDKWFR
jgi:hypothetical protein